MAIIVHKHKGGKVKGAAPGDAPNTGAPGFTPPPTKPVAPDVISRPRAPIGAGYGMSGGAENPSSINAGTKLESPMASNLRASVDDDGLLDRLQRQGSTRGVIADVDLQSPQTRDVSKEPYPTAHGMKPANVGGAPSGTVPSKLGEVVAQPVRKPQ
jgi:hypothetical protein